MHAWAEVCYLSQSSKSVLTGFLSRCVQVLADYEESLFLIQQSCIIITFRCLVVCVHAYAWRKNGVAIEKEAIALQWVVQTSLWDFKPGKKRRAGALLSGKCCCFVWNHRKRVMQIWTSLSEEEEERKTFWHISSEYTAWLLIDWTSSPINWQSWFNSSLIELSVFYPYTAKPKLLFQQTI